MLTVRTAYDGARKTFRVQLAQSLAPTPGQSEKTPAAMPIALGLVDPEGGDLPLASADASPEELRSRVFALEGARRTSESLIGSSAGAFGAARVFGEVRVDNDLTERCRHASPARQRQLQPLGGPSEPGDPAFAALGGRDSRG